jgi:hypothetical protein
MANRTKELGRSKEGNGGAIAPPRIRRTSPGGGGCPASRREFRRTNGIIGSPGRLARSAWKMRSITRPAE